MIGAQDISFQSMAEKMRRYTKITMADPAVDTMADFTGGQTALNQGRFFLALKPLEERGTCQKKHFWESCRYPSADDVINRLRGKLAVVPGATLILQSAQELTIGGRYGNAQYQYTLQSADISELNSWAPRLLAKMTGADAALREAAEIEHALATEEGHISELFTTFRRPLLLGIMLAGLQQISGITPIFSFLPEIFRTAGTATSDAFFQSVLVSLINLLFTLFALWLIDRAGRKTLILTGTGVQFVSLALVGCLYHIHGSGLAVLVFVMSFVAGHAFGNGVACWVIISEIYPTKVRGRGMSIATTALWLVGYLGNQLFPIMQKHLGSDGTFWVFSAGALLTLVLVGWLIPETKGRSLEEITKLWIQQKAQKK